MTLGVPRGWGSLWPVLRQTYQGISFPGSRQPHAIKYILSPPCRSSNWYQIPSGGTLHNVVNADGDNLAIGSALTAKYFAKAPKLFYNFLERGPGAQIMIWLRNPRHTGPTLSPSLIRNIQEYHGYLDAGIILLRIWLRDKEARILLTFRKFLIYFSLHSLHKKLLQMIASVAKNK